MRSRSICTLSAILAAVLWSKAQAEQPLTLGSQKSVNVLSVGPLQSTAGWTALMLKYRTAISLSDVPELRKEADEVWDRFIVDLERSGYQNAIISANGPEKGVILTTNTSYNFIYKKSEGVWRTIESNDRTKAKLDPAFVREFVDRIDWLLTNNEMNALLLYMANDWTVTIVDPSQNTSAPQKIDRMQFVASTHAAFAAATSRHHHREITDISITEAGDGARVESLETEDIAVNGHQITGTEHSTDTFELRDDIMAWTKSSSVIDKRTEPKNN
jgi:hypothetical protein